MCYDMGEVISMEEERNETELQPAPKRPGWQVWGARILLVVFIALIVMYYCNIARGGR